MEDEDMKAKKEEGESQDPAEEAAPAAEPEAGPEETAGWTMGTWKGLPQWRCRLCNWDTVKSEAEMRKHLAEAHGPRERRTIALPLVDARGRQIRREVEES